MEKKNIVATVGGAIIAAIILSSQEVLKEAAKDVYSIATCKKDWLFWCKAAVAAPNPKPPENPAPPPKAPPSTQTGRYLGMFYLGEVQNGDVWVNQRLLHAGRIQPRALVGEELTVGNRNATQPLRQWPWPENLFSDTANPSIGQLTPNDRVRIIDVCQIESRNGAYIWALVHTPGGGEPSPNRFVMLPQCIHVDHWQKFLAVK